MSKVLPGLAYFSESRAENGKTLSLVRGNTGSRWGGARWRQASSSWAQAGLSRSGEELEDARAEPLSRSGVKEPAGRWVDCGSWVWEELRRCWRWSCLGDQPDLRCSERVGEVDREGGERRRKEGGSRGRAGRSSELLRRKRPQRWQIMLAMILSSNVIYTSPESCSTYIFGQKKKEQGIIGFRHPHHA